MSFPPSEGAIQVAPKPASSPLHLTKKVTPDVDVPVCPPRTGVNTALGVRGLGAMSFPLALSIIPQYMRLSVREQRVARAAIKLHLDDGKQHGAQSQPAPFPPTTAPRGIPQDKPLRNPQRPINHARTPTGQSTATSALRKAA